MIAPGLSAPARHGLLRFGLLVALAVLVADQATKWAVLGPIDLDARMPGIIEVTGFFNLVMVRNYGVSFGMFADDAGTTRWALVVLALGVTAALLVWLRRVERRFPAAAIGLVIGGAVGNVIDRLRFGAVVDFLDLHVLGYHWPAFNVADSAITIGVVLLVADGLFGRPAQGATLKPEEGP